MDKKSVLPIHGVVQVLELELPQTLQRGVEFRLEAELLTTKGQEIASAYLAFFRGEELWYVAELGQLTQAIGDGRAYRLCRVIRLEGDLPDGVYMVRFGLHQYHAEGSDHTAITVSGGTMHEGNAWTPMSYGTYCPEKTGTCHFWYVNQNHALIWDGAPYVPIGGMVCPDFLIFYDPNDPEGNRQRWERDADILKMLSDRGIRHIYLNTIRDFSNLPPEVLERYLNQLENLHIFYGLQISCPNEDRETEYFAIRAAGEKIEVSARGPGLITADGPPNVFTSPTFLKEAASKYIVIDRSCGTAVDSGTGIAEYDSDGRMHYQAEITVPQGGDYAVCFTPWVRVTESQFVDPWRHLDTLEKRYLAFVRRFRAGDHFRMFLDPLNNESGFCNSAESVRLTGEAHQVAYTSWLEARYGSLDRLNKAWKLSPAANSFTQAAALIPVYTEEKTQTMFLLDMETDAVSCADGHHGVLWDDYLQFRNAGLRSLNDQVADWFKSTSNTNVPVVYKHVSVLRENNISRRTAGGFDGLGGEIYGNFLTSSAKRGYPFAEAEQARKTIWYLITECNTEEDMECKTKYGPVTYESKAYMHRFFREHMEDGAKGIYDFLVYGDFYETLLAYSYHSRPETYDWSREFRETVERRSTEIVRQMRGPEHRRLYLYPGAQAWWYPPNGRTAALPGTDYQNARILMLHGERVLPTFYPEVPKDGLLINLEDTPATLTWGQRLNRYMENRPKREIVVYLGLRKDLGSLPALDAYFTDEIVDMADGAKIQVLKPTAASEVLAETETGQVWALRDGMLWIYANTGWNRGPLCNEQYTEISRLQGFSLPEENHSF